MNKHINKSKKHKWIGETKEEKKMLAKRFLFFGRIVLIGGIIFLLLPSILTSKKFFPKQFLIKNGKNLYKNDKNIKLDISYYESPDVVVTLKSTTTDNFTINEEKLKKLSMSESILIADKDDQSDLISSDSASYGFVSKSGQIYGLMENSDMSVMGCFLVEHPEKITKDIYKSPTDEILSIVVNIDSKKIEYLGSVTIDKEPLFLFRIMEPDGEKYLYYSEEKEMLTRTIKISQKTVQVTDISPLDEEITFFESMKTFNAFNLIEAEEFLPLYQNYAFYVLSTSETLKKQNINKK